MQAHRRAAVFALKEVGIAIPSWNEVASLDAATVDRLDLPGFLLTEFSKNPLIPRFAAPLHAETD